FIFNMLKTDTGCQNATNDAALLPAVVENTGVNIILEFEQAPTTCSSAYSLTTYWKYLTRYPFGTSYNSWLAWLTSQTVTHPNPTRPNQSQLKQVRTNVSESFSQWTLREFRLGGLNPISTSSTNALLMVPPAASPDFR